MDEVFASKFGVRALKRLIQDQVENPLSLLIMQEKIHPGIPVFLNVNPSGRKLQVYAKKGEQKIEPPTAPKGEEIPEGIAEEDETKQSDNAPEIEIENAQDSDTSAS